MRRHPEEIAAFADALRNGVIEGAPEAITISDRASHRARVEGVNLVRALRDEFDALIPATATIERNEA